MAAYTPSVETPKNPKKMWNNFTSAYPTPRTTQGSVVTSPEPELAVLNWENWLPESAKWGPFPLRRLPGRRKRKADAISDPKWVRPPPCKKRCIEAKPGELPTPPDSPVLYAKRPQDFEEEEKETVVPPVVEEVSSSTTPLKKRSRSSCEEADEDEGSKVLEVDIGSKSKRPRLERDTNKSFKAQRTPAQPELVLQSEPPIGIHNRANRCYQNSAIQALLATIGGKDLKGSLSEHIGANDSPRPQHRRGIGSFAQETWKHDASEFNLAAALVNSFKELRKRSDTSEPSSKPVHLWYTQAILARVVGQQWDGQSQQDAVEYLQIILDCLAKGKNFLKDDAEPHRVIEDLFQVRNQYEFRCHNPDCGHAWTSKPEADLGWFLHLFPPEEATSTTIGDLLEHLRKPETIPDFKCERCNEKKMTKTWIGLEHPPEVLIMQFDRKGDAISGSSHVEDVKKSTYSIDLAENVPLAGITINKSDEMSKDYKLVSVIKHDGSDFRCGHYVAYMNTQQGWFCADDAKVSASSMEEVQDPTEFGDAYLAFYQRVV